MKIMNEKQAAKMQVVKIGDESYDIARLSFSAMNRILRDPRAYWDDFFGEPEELSAALIRGIETHRLLLQPEAPSRFVAAYSPVAGRTITTKDELMAALDGVSVPVPEGDAEAAAVKPVKSAAKSAWVNWAREYAPDVYARLKDVEEAAHGGAGDGLTAVPQDVLDEAKWLADESRHCLDFICRKFDIADGEAVLERKLIEELVVTLPLEDGEECEIGVNFSGVPDLYAPPKEGRPLLIMDIKTFAPWHLHDLERNFRNQIYKLKVMEQMYFYRKMLANTLGTEAVKGSILLCMLIPANAPYNAAVYRCKEDESIERGENFEAEAMGKWLDCVQAFGGLNGEQPWRNPNTYYRMPSAEDEGFTVAGDAPEDAEDPGEKVAF